MPTIDINGQPVTLPRCDCIPDRITPQKISHQKQCAFAKAFAEHVQRLGGEVMPWSRLEEWNTAGEPLIEMDSRRADSRMAREARDLARLMDGNLPSRALLLDKLADLAEAVEQYRAARTERDRALLGRTDLPARQDDVVAARRRMFEAIE